MNRLFLFIFLSMPVSIAAQVCKCDSVFVEVQKIVEKNYAGWFDKVNRNNRNDYENFTKSYVQNAALISSDSACIAVLQDWIRFFQDKHLRIQAIKQNVNGKSEAKNKSIEIITTGFTLNDIQSYFTKTSKLDPIEGFYESETYKLGITKFREDLFYATVLTSSNTNWKPGEVKLVIRKIGNQYEGDFYEGDKSDISTHPVQLVDNLLDFDIIFFEKTFPAVAVKRDFTEYEMSKDKYAPSLTFKEDVALWKFPSFQNNSYEQTAYLLKKYKKELDSTPYWVLDLTNNSGGDYSIGLQLMEYIYSKPILLYNSEMRLTESNYNIWYNSYIADYYESADSTTKAGLDSRFNKMKANFNTMYNEDGRAIDTLQLASVKTFPTKIALLINQGTVSSGELFTMIARQSDKVVVMGNNTGGMIDYGNIINYKTSCSSIRVQLPTGRYLWLNTGYSVDKNGLTPSVYLNGSGWVEQAIERIKK